jgi:hypothetical protein
MPYGKPIWFRLANSNAIRTRWHLKSRGDAGLFDPLRRAQIEVRTFSIGFVFIVVGILQHLVWIACAFCWIHLIALSQ